jgi:phosphorylcholine metabolism protein LicD
MDTQTALENLILARNVLEAVKVRYFLIDGTLLGLTRGGRFIEWDDDIDVGIFAEDFNVRTFGLFAAAMKQNGFSYHTEGGWKRTLTAHWWRKNLRIDFSFYFRRGDQRVIWVCAKDEFIEFSYPAKLIEELVSVDFYGSPFMVPKEREAVLTHSYGDWKVPRTDYNWKTSPLHISARTKTTTGKRVRSFLSRHALRASVWLQSD